MRQSRVCIDCIRFVERGVSRVWCSCGGVSGAVELAGHGGVKRLLREPRETCLLVPNPGLLPNISLFPKAPVVLVVLGWTNVLVVVVPVVDLNPLVPNVPVVPNQWWVWGHRTRSSCPGDSSQMSRLTR